MYGHRCAVNFDWPWCPPAAPGPAVDLRIVLGSLGRFAGVDPAAYAPYGARPEPAPTEALGFSVARAADGHFRVTYAAGAEFAIDATASEVFGVARGGLTLDDLVVYLQGPITGFVLRLRGVTCLHASAAICDGRAFAVVGQGG